MSDEERDPPDIVSGEIVVPEADPHQVVSSGAAEVIEHPHQFVSSAATPPEVVEHPQSSGAAPVEVAPEIVEHPHLFVSSGVAPVEAAPEVVEHPHLFVSAPVVTDSSEAPLLPEAYSEAELRSAAGVPSAEPEAKPRKRPRTLDDPEDDLPHRRSARTVLVAAGSLVVGLGIVVLIFLGRANSDHYTIACEPDLIVAQQGRAFPPWGWHTLAGAEWKPIAIPPEAECRTRDTEELPELTAWYLQLLVDQASSLLTAREVTKVELAEQQLKQALILARAPERRDDRKEIERLLGDVGYWRASAKLRDAAAALADAAKQFDEAAAQRPRHVTDASAWSAYLRKLVDQLHVGPSGATQAAFPTLPVTPERPAAPPGVALPVEPDRGSDAPPTPAAAPADAGLPTGGVLL